jgi:type IV pilus assembly protein PilB
MAGDDDIERLGDLLIEEGIITYEEAADSVKTAGQSNTVLGRLLLQSNPVRRKELASFLAMDAEVPYLDLDKVEIQPHDPPFIPEGVARKHECVPLGRIQNILIVAKANVMNRAAVIDIRKMTGLKVKVLRGD